MPSRLMRSAWSSRKRAELDSADIVFLDPDNGLGAETAKHATFSEVGRLRKPGRAVVVITFPGRKMTHDALLRKLHGQLSTEARAEGVVTLRTNVSLQRAEGSGAYVQRQRWFTIIDPDAGLIARARVFANALASIPRVRARLDGIV
jgi:hypothetical protein